MPRTRDRQGPCGGALDGRTYRADHRRHPSRLRRSAGDRLQRAEVLHHLRFATRQQIALFDCAVPAELLVRNYLPMLFHVPCLEDRERVERYVRSVLRNPHPVPRPGYLHQTGALRRFDTRAILDGIVCPTRVIGAEQDLLTPLSGSEYLATHIPEAELKVIPDCGHGVFIENPDLFYGLILDFIQIAPDAATGS